MRLVSVAERELRAAARHKGLYHLRWLTAAGAFAFLLWLGWVLDVFQNKSAGPEAFRTFAAVIFVYCLFVGAAGTADSISRERREGTLGLLFLTNLNSAEIVAGKVFSNGLALLYSLLAIFPVMALPVLIGGITFGQFWRTVLALLGGLFFAIAAGFTASSVCVRQFPAIGLATGLTLAWSLGLLGAAAVLRKAGLPNSTTDYVAGFSPLQTLLSAYESGRMLRQSQYWFSLAAVCGLSWIWLALAAWRTGRTWRDRPKPIRWWQRLRWSERFRQRGSAARAGFRRRLLGINPFFWLASRQRVSAPVFMGLAVGLVLITVGVTAPFFGGLFPKGFATAPMAAHLLAWGWTVLAIHGLLLYYGATVASQRLAEDKQSGALELILSTPATERSIARGLWLAYGRRMFFPALIAVLVHVFFIWQVLTLMVLDPPAGKLALGVTPGQIFWSAICDQPLQGMVLDWQFGFILRGLLAVLVALVANWFMLGWVGRWLGLRLKHPGFAPLTAVALALMPPILLFSLACYVFGELHLFQLSERVFLPLMIWIALSIALANCGAWSAWAAGRWRRDFRGIVTNRYAPPAALHWGRTIWRWVVRLTVAAGAAALVLGLVVLGFYGYQNRQAQRRWTAFQKQLQQRGESLDLAPLLSGPVPAGQNFAQTPAFKNLVAVKTTDKAAAALLRESLRHSGINLAQNNAAVFILPWMQQSNAPFTRQLDWINPKSSAGVNQPRSQAAAEIWNGLQPLQADLNALARAAQLPFFQVTTNRNAAAVCNANSRELAAVEQLNFLFQLRASALLELNREAEAGADVLTALQLAQLARQAPDLKSSMRVQVMLAQTLQPIWDGLAKQRWPEAQLRMFQNELARFDLLSDHTNTIHRVVLAYLETWRALPEAKPGGESTAPGGSPQSPQLELDWLPRVWRYDACIQLHQAGQNAMARVDFANGRVSDELDWRDLEGLQLDGVATQLFQQGSWFGNNPELVSVAQTFVNQAVIACALERYRLARGDYPESLESLRPTYLNSIPRESSRGRPMFYQRDAKAGYELRGVGPNGIIDQGKLPSDDLLWSFTPPATNAPPAKAANRK